MLNPFKPTHFPVKSAPFSTLQSVPHRIATSVMDLSEPGSDREAHEAREARDFREVREARTSGGPEATGATRPGKFTGKVMKRGFYDDFMGLYDDFMRFYRVSMGLYGVLMRFYRVLMEVYSDEWPFTLS